MSGVPRDGEPTGLYTATHRQLWRLNSGGFAFRVWERIVPRIHDRVMDCGIYLYSSVEDAERGEQAGGSGFLVGVPFKNFPPQSWWHCYAVTNAHVIEGNEFAKPAPVVRININLPPKPKARTMALPLTTEQWIIDPNGNDLAIASIDLDLYIHRFIFLVSILEDGRAFFMSPEIQSQIGLGMGDEVFMIGRFMPRDESGPNTPLARFGHLANTNVEPIMTERGMQESFLAEIHSISGFSGSPVFVRVPEHRVNPISEEDKKNPNWPLKYFGRLLDYKTYFLGIDWGHLGTDENDFPGMTGIVPAWKLTDLLNSDMVLTMQNKEEERVRKQTAGKLDNRTGTGQSSQKGKAIPVPTEKQFLDDLAKATRKRKPSS
jgi:hypothetical protein